MHYVGFAELAAAVSNAGGLGCITGLTQKTAGDLANEIARCNDMTDKSFAVNLTFLPTVTTPDYGGYVKAIIEGGVTVACGIVGDRRGGHEHGHTYGQRSPRRNAGPKRRRFHADLPLEQAGERAHIAIADFGDDLRQWQLGVFQQQFGLFDADGLQVFQCGHAKFGAEIPVERA